MPKFRSQTSKEVKAIITFHLDSGYHHEKRIDR